MFPLLIGFLVTTLETIGDIGAVYDASEEPIDDNEEFDKSVQGGLLSDGVCSFLAALGTGMPNTTFSQNNGVIALTKCASRRAGVACGCWLILFGVLAKISGIISAIPDCVIGGMTTFLFVNVFISGLNTVAKSRSYVPPQPHDPRHLPRRGHRRCHRALGSLLISARPATPPPSSLARAPGGPRTIARRPSRLSATASSSSSPPPTASAPSLRSS